MTERSAQFHSAAPACPVCGSTGAETFFELESVPVECNVLFEDRATAQSVTRGSIALSFCSRCGHIFNTRFDPSLVTYSASYENSLHFSPRFQQYAAGLAQDLVERRSLRSKHIVEIGSGKGDFLHLLCEMGGSTGAGYDPSYDGSGSPFAEIRFVKGFFDEQSEPGADFLCSRHTLEHIPDPARFARMLRRAAGTRRAGVFLEVPNARYTLDELAVWDLIYEHCSYFTAPSLAHLLTSAGFNACAVSETFGGQFLTIEAEPSSGPKGSYRGSAPLPEPARFLPVVKAFQNHFDAKHRMWRARLNEIRSAGKRAVIWGAGSKGISFLNMLEVKDEITYVVDINPRKLGRYISGSGQQIIAPDQLRQIQPDLVILMNPIYQAEITQTLASLGLNPEIQAA